MSYRPRFAISPTLLTRVEAVAALRERIQAAAVQVAWIPALQKDTRARNAHSSTAIEGNPLTLEQVHAVEAGRRGAELRLDPEAPRRRETPAGTDAFAAAFKGVRRRLVGGDGIALEEFPAKPAGHWARS